MVANGLKIFGQIEKKQCTCAKLHCTQKIFFAIFLEQVEQFSRCMKMKVKIWRHLAVSNP